MEKRQEMAAIVCVYDSGEFDVVSCHFALHDAVEQLDFMRDEGYDKDWNGTLMTVCNGTVHACVNVEKLQQAIRNRNVR